MRGTKKLRAKLSRRTKAELMDEVLDLRRRVDGSTNDPASMGSPRVIDAEARLRGAIDSLQEGFALFDADDRLVAINDVYGRINPLAARGVETGMRFEDMLRANVAAGRIVDAVGREEAFIRERMKRHRNPGSAIVHRRSSGNSYLSKETRTPDGGTALTLTDVTAIEKAEREARARSKQLEMIADLGQQAVRDPDLKKLFRDAARRLAKVLSVEMCKILLLTPEGDAVRLVAGVGWKRGLVGKAKVGIGLDSQAGYTLQSKDAVIVEDLQSETRFSGPPLLHDHGVISGISVVIGNPDNPYGVLGVHTTSRRTFTDNEVTALQGVAEVIASAIWRNDANTKIAASEQRLRGAIESLQEGFALFDADDRLVAINDVYGRINPQAQEILERGLRFEDLIRANVGAGVIVEALGREEDFIRERVAQHRDPKGPIIRQRSDGNWYALQETRTRDGGTALTFIDITELKNANSALHESEQRLRGAIDSLQEGFALFDADDRLVAINDVYRRFNPLAQEGLEKGMRFEDMVRANVKEGRMVEALGREEAFIRERIAQHRNPQGPVVRHRSDGSVYVILEARTPDGAAALTVTDISELEMAETALRESEEQFRAFVDHSPAAIYIKDTKSRYLLVNRQFEEWYGLSQEEAVGKTARDFFPKEFAERYLAQDRAVVESGRILEEATQAPHTDGTLHLVNTVKFPIFDDGGKITAIGGINTDVTERRRVEEALRQSLEQDRRHLGQLSKVLRAGTVAEMASALAHQLNQPLSAVANYSRGLRNKLNGGKMTEGELTATLATIAEQSERAATIVRDIADFIRGSEGTVSSVDINELVIRAARFLKPELDESRIKLDLDLSSKTPKIDAVPIEIEQAILNLAMNSVDAINASDDGDRRLTIRTALDGEDAVCVSVLDTGAGVSAEILGALFQPFTSTKADGMGMGLAISQTIVEKHHGRIWTGRNGRTGTAFHFTLPKEAPVDAP